MTPFFQYIYAKENQIREICDKRHIRIERNHYDKKRIKRADFLHAFPRGIS